MFSCYVKLTILSAEPDGFYLSGEFYTQLIELKKPTQCYILKVTDSYQKSVKSSMT